MILVAMCVVGLACLALVACLFVVRATFDFTEDRPSPVKPEPGKWAKARAEMDRIWAQHLLNLTPLECRVDLDELYGGDPEEPGDQT